jgi:hypothetical protein
MAKSKKKSDPGLASPMPFPSDEEYQTRDDVDRLMRADEVHSDPDRLKRAHSRISGVAERLSKKKHGRPHGRSGGR